MKKKMLKEVSNKTPNKTSYLVLLFAFTASILVDLGSTVLYPNFLALESNPLVLSTNINAFFLLIFVKVFVLILGILSFLWFKRINNTDFSKFFWVCIILGLTIIQFFAGYNNISVVNQTTILVNEKYETNYSYADVPIENINEFKAEDTIAMKQYFALNLLVLYLPLFFSLSSFWVWKKIWCKYN